MICRTQYGCALALALLALPAAAQTARKPAQPIPAQITTTQASAAVSKVKKTTEVVEHREGGDVVAGKKAPPTGPKR